MEYESKAMITASDYDRLMHVLGGGRSSGLQVNYYYDTDDEYFRSKNVTCRIRKSDKGLSGKVKIHIFDGESEENSFYITDVPSHLELCGERLALKGSLCTLRTRLEGYGRVKIMLDKNIYLGKTDYEVEIERERDALSEAVAAMDMISRLLGKALSWNGGDSKSERFFKRLEFVKMDRYPETAIGFEGDGALARDGRT